MGSNLTRLEETIVENARAELTRVLNFLANGISGMSNDEVEEAYRDYVGNHHALSALVGIAHQSNSGLSIEAASILRRIQDEEVAAHIAVQGSNTFAKIWKQISQNQKHQR